MNNRLNRLFLDTSHMPVDFANYINNPKRKPRNNMVLDVIKEANGIPITIDEFIVGFYNRHGVLIDRSNAAARLRPYLLDGRLTKEQDKIRLTLSNDNRSSRSVNE